jgi:hypothetical protein
MHLKKFCFTVAAALIATTPALAQKHFNRIASFPTHLNMAAGEDQNRTSSAEIIYATADGMTLVYTDSPLNSLGRIDIRNPREPKPLGNIALSGEPTSVTVIGNTAFAGVNTSVSYRRPSGELAAFDVRSGASLGACPLSGQPDSVAADKDGTFIAVAIENERDEDLNDGIIPQMPAGSLEMIEVRNGRLDCNSVRRVDLTGLANVAPSDPEPEFVDINGLGQTVITLQENNHLVVVNRDGSLYSHFSAGSVDLMGIDATDERGALIFNENQMGRLREPDAVNWIDDNHFAIANEGDYHGGSRGWTIFHKNGGVVYEAGTSFERALIEIGHYPDKRSDAKGVEPESIEFGVFDDIPMVFVGSERGSAVGVYDVSNPAEPRLHQILPSGIGPEGYIVIPERNLLISANEEDLIEDGGVRSHVMIFEWQNAPAMYPTLTSAGAGALIGWGAISGMVAGDDGMVYAVNDSFYGYQPTIFKIDPREQPARIVDATPLHRAGRPAQKLDLEGITTDGEGGFYVASEGRTGRMIPHGIYHVDRSGEIQAEIPFPAELLAVERRHGSEGITRVGNTLWIALQRSWQDDAKNTVKLVSYNLDTKEWATVSYPTEAPAKGWIGLSEIVAHGDWFYIIERDNQIGAEAVVKRIYRVAASEMRGAPLGQQPPLVKKELVRDLIPDLAQYGGYIVDKVEGLAIMADGTAYVSTDNDGVDDSSGETFFWSIGKVD